MWGADKMVSLPKSVAPQNHKRSAEVTKYFELIQLLVTAVRNLFVIIIGTRNKHWNGSFCNRAQSSTKCGYIPRGCL